MLVSSKATNHVRSLRLPPGEKLVAFIHADHAAHDPDAHKKGLSGVTYASMTTVANEAGFKRRETASRNTRQLLIKNVLVLDATSGKQGKPNVYRINLNSKTCDARVTPRPKKSVTPKSHLPKPTCDSGCGEPVTPIACTCDDAVAQRVEGIRKEGEGSLMQFSQDQSASKPQELIQTPFPTKKAIKETAEYINANVADGPPRAHLEKGLFRTEIGKAYSDATQAGMSPQDCVREAISAGAVTLLMNRGAELQDLGRERLEGSVWERIRPNVAALCLVRDFETRRLHVIAVVTRCITDVALEFWRRAGFTRAKGGQPKTFDQMRRERTDAAMARVVEMFRLAGRHAQEVPLAGTTAHCVSGDCCPSSCPTHGMGERHDIRCTRIARSNPSRVD
jgi:hypothetical protein